MKKKTDNQIFMESVLAATVLFALLSGAIAAIWYYSWYGVLGVAAVCIYFYMLDGIYTNGKEMRDKGDKKE